MITIKKINFQLISRFLVSHPGKDAKAHICAMTLTEKINPEKKKVGLVNHFFLMRSHKNPLKGYIPEISIKYISS